MRFLFIILFLSGFARAAEVGSGKILGGTSLVDKSMNPAISVNGLFLGGYGTTLPDNERGLRIQEVEAQFTAAVDPYFMGNIIVTSEAAAPLEIEEAYTTTLSIPHVTLKAGKYLAAFGKNNIVHTHAQSLIDRPLVNRTLFGDGLNSFGVEASILVPVPWYMDLTLGAMSGSQTPVYATNSTTSLFGVARLENLFDLTDSTTFSLGVSYTGGDNQLSNQSHFYGADVTLKYVSGKGKGEFALAWTNEFIKAKRVNYGNLVDSTGAPAPDWEDGCGAYSTLLARLSSVFWVGGRFDYVKTVLAGDQKVTGENLVFAYVPSEFSAIRLQGGIVQPPGGGSTQWNTYLQYNMTIGSHPAHAY